MLFLCIILIIIIIKLSNNNKDLSNEIHQLKSQSGVEYNFCPNCGFKLNKNQNISYETKNLQYEESDDNIIFDSIKVNDFESEKTNNKELKNSLILISGSILIVLSAIIFLTSTWSITHNFFKTIIIILMLGVFISASYIADKILKLKQTSNAFYYMALAYIPILLLSIALFELFGKYLSLYGLGKYIYLTFSSFLVSGIYYYNAKKRNNSIIAIFGIIFQILGIIFITLNFTGYDNLRIIMIILLLHNLLLIIGYTNKKFYYSPNFHLKLINTFTISFSVITTLGLIDNLNYTIVLEDIILEILLMINCYYLLTKINNKEKIYNYIYPLLTITIFYSIACALKDDFLIKQLMILLSFVVIYLYEYFKNNEIRISSYFEILGTLILLSIYTYDYIDCANSIDSSIFLGLKSYIILGIFLLINIFNYLITNKYKLIQAYTLTITFIITFLSITNNISLSIISIIINYLALGLIIISLFIRKLDDNFKQSFYWVGHVTIWLFTLACLLSTNKTALLLVYKLIVYSIYMIICYYEGITKNKNHLKIISYIYFNIATYYLVSLLKLNNIYIIPFTTLIIVTIEYLIPKLRSKISDIYIIIQFIVTFISLLEQDLISFILLFIMGIIFICYIHNYKKNDNYLYIPTLMMIPYIYDSNILIFNNFNYMYIISIVSILAITSLIYIKNKNFYIILFYIYIFFHITCIEECKYVSILLLLTGTFISQLQKENKTKDIFKLLLYLIIFILYKFIIEDLNLIDLTILTTGSYFILLLVITRTIIKKYNDSYKILEYLSGVLINIIALSNYTSEGDGIIYVVFLTGLVMISYIYKYGPIFLVCLISILLNVFILTKTFWFSIPWYLYILLIGSILVGFSIYNEILEKKNKNIKNKIVNIKDNLDL